MAINAKGGSVVIGNEYPSTFLGSSSTGGFPPIGTQAKAISFKPKENESGIMAFGIKQPKGHTSYNVWYFRWEGGKVVVSDMSLYSVGTILQPYAISDPDGFILGAQVDDSTYVAKMPKDAPAGNYKIVDIILLMKYIEGKIDIGELSRNARQIQIRKKVWENYTRLLDFHEDKAVGLQKALMSAEKALRASEAERQEMGLHLELTREAKARLTKDKHRLMTENGLKTNLIDSLRWLLDFYQQIPEWLRPLFVRKTLRRQDRVNELKAFHGE